MAGDLSGSKWGYVTRRVSSTDRLRRGEVSAFPRLGDFAVATVVKVGEHEALENPYGRRMQLYPGDTIVGAFGNRYATDFYEGYLPTEGEPVHLLTSGGLLGTVTSAHSSRSDPTELEVVGSLVDPSGSVLNTDDVALELVPGAVPALGTIVVVGSSMNSGKTTATSAILHGFAKKGRRPGAGKVTGSGSGKDHWSYVDAGAAAVSDFLDFGMPSTFGYPPERLSRTMRAIQGKLVADGAEVVVLEIADGLLHSETNDLAAELPDFADVVVLAVGDALGAIAGLKVLADLGVSVDAVSGLLTASPLAIREAIEATGLPVLTRDQLSSRAGVYLELNGAGPNGWSPEDTAEALG